jgi:molybdopterin-guanine dinucleotide biosynthesis protein A
MKRKHLKHPKLDRPSVGFYHRLEWAILGTDCDHIRVLSQYIMEQAKMPIAYLDHTHNPCQNPNLYVSEDGKLIDANTGGRLDQFSLFQTLEPYAYILVNGNHRPASRQIIVLDLVKKESLRRRLDQCTDIDLIIHKSGKKGDFDFIWEHLENNDREVLQLRWDDMSGIYNFIESRYRDLSPDVKALVLVGGESLRMGEDKSKIAYHGMPQYQYIANICHEKGLETFISSREHMDKMGGFPVIVDRINGMGPFGAICTAFMSDPDSAWLVLATDVPLLKSSDIEKLLLNRDPSMYATCFKHPDKEFPEPLITLFEPKIYSRFMYFLSQGYSCPRKVLINSRHKAITPDDPASLINVNTPEEKEMVIQQLKIQG